MGRERRFPLLPETSILELLTLRRTDLTVNKDLDLQQDHPPHPRRETLTTSKTQTLDSSRGSKPDHNNFLNNNRDNSNSSNNNNHRDSQRPLHPQGSSVFLSKSNKESTG